MVFSPKVVLFHTRVCFPCNAVAPSSNISALSQVPSSEIIYLPDHQLHYPLHVPTSPISSLLYTSHPYIYIYTLFLPVPGNVRSALSKQSYFDVSDLEDEGREVFANSTSATWRTPGRQEFAREALKEAVDNAVVALNHIELPPVLQPRRYHGPSSIDS